MNEISDMRGKAALVTGAASGLGRATALRLAKAGAQVCLVDINEEALEDSARAARAFDVRALALAIDLSRKTSCTESVTRTVEAFGRLDALCNIAAVFHPGHTTAMSTEAWEKTLAVNLSAPFYLMQASIPHLLHTHGAIVNVTSCAGLVGQAYLAAYSATKAGLTHMTKSLAMEYMNQPIRINAVAPGGMLTPLAGAMRQLPQDVDRSVLQRISPMRGMVDVEDVAATVAFLASDAARGFHGACISIDNGITAG